MATSKLALLQCCSSLEFPKAAFSGEDYMLAGEAHLEL